MAEHSEGRPDSGNAPVFVDGSGGRRRRWRRLGWALGAVGGGYALVVAVSLIGGSSDAPWGVLIPGADDGGTGASRVVPEADDESANRTFGAGPTTSATPRPSAPAPSGRAPAGRADSRGTGTSTPGGTGAARASGTDAQPAPGRSGRADEGKTTSSSGGGAAGGGTASSGGSGGADPSGGAANGGGGGGGGTPSDPSTDPAPSPSESPSEDGFLDRVLEQLEGAGGDGSGAPAAGAG